MPSLRRPRDHAAIWDLHPSGHDAVDTWFFNGAVAGSVAEIEAALGAPCETLSFAGFPSRFEIHDEAFGVMDIAAFPRSSST